jgi:uncharacterized delta-60 repeat protein
MKKLILIATVLFANNSIAQTVNLDNTFGIQGIASFDLGITSFISSGIEQPDGKILCYISAGGQTDQTFLMRISETGEPDLTFGLNGFVSLPNFQPAGKISQSLFLQSDGMILIAGSVFNVSLGYSNFAVSRITNNGNVDLNFGTNGIAKVNFPNGSSYAASIDIQSDGKIIAAGSCLIFDSFSHTDFAISRFTTSGIIDTSFGNNGSIITFLQNRNDDATAVTIDNQDNIYAVGSTGFYNDSCGIIRLTPNGNLDNTYSSDGKITLPQGFLNYYGGYGIALDNDNKLVIVKSQSESGLKIGVSRINFDGSMDNTFGINGFTNFHYANADFHTFSLEIDNSNRILIGSSYTIYSPSGDYFSVARINPDGNIDNTFNNTGFSSTLLNTNPASSSSVCVDICSGINNSIYLFGSKNSIPTIVKHKVSSTSEISENNDVSLNIYPNPSNDFININYSDYTPYNCRFYDMKGAIFFDNKNIIGQVTIDLKNYEKGVYFIEVVSSSGSIIEKIVRN